MGGIGGFLRGVIPAAVNAGAGYLQGQQTGEQRQRTRMIQDEERARVNRQAADEDAMSQLGRLLRIGQLRSMGIVAGDGSDGGQPNGHDEQDGAPSTGAPGAALPLPGAPSPTGRRPLTADDLLRAGGAQGSGAQASGAQGSALPLPGAPSATGRRPLTPDDVPRGGAGSSVVDAIRRQRLPVGTANGQRFVYDPTQDVNQQAKRAQIDQRRASTARASAQAQLYEQRATPMTDAEAQDLADKLITAGHDPDDVVAGITAFRRGDKTALRALTGRDPVADYQEKRDYMVSHMPARGTAGAAVPLPQRGAAASARAARSAYGQNQRDVAGVTTQIKTALGPFSTHADSAAAAPLLARRDSLVARGDSLRGAADRWQEQADQRGAAPGARPAPSATRAGAKSADDFYAAAAQAYKQDVASGLPESQARAKYDAVVAKIAHRFGQAP